MRFTSHNGLLSRAWSVPLTMVYYQEHEVSRSQWLTIKSDLENRKWRVRWKTCLSNPQPVPAGVPQGGGLSPLLFVLCTNTLDSSLLRQHPPCYVRWWPYIHWVVPWQATWPNTSSSQCSDNTYLNLFECLLVFHFSYIFIKCLFIELFMFLLLFYSLTYFSYCCCIVERWNCK